MWLSTSYFNRIVDIADLLLNINAEKKNDFDINNNTKYQQSFLLK